jgi:hypothetical protein
MYNVGRYHTTPERERERKINDKKVQFDMYVYTLISVGNNVNVCMDGMYCTKIR